MDNACSQPICVCCVGRLILCDEQFRRYEVFKREQLKLGAIFAMLYKKMTPLTTILSTVLERLDVCF